MELLVRVFDKERKKRQRGHVIVAQDNGWEWSWMEKQSHAWIILRVPEVHRRNVECLESKIDLDYLSSRGYRISGQMEARARYYMKHRRPVDFIRITKEEFIESHTLRTIYIKGKAYDVKKSNTGLLMAAHRERWAA